MTIKELEDYKYLSSEVEALQNQINSLYSAYHSPAFDNIGGFSGNVSNPTEDAVNRIITLQNRLQEKRDQMVSEMQRIEKWIDSLDNQEIKSIVRWHYLLNASWKQVNRKVYGYANDRQAYRVFRRFMGVDKN